MEQNIGDGRVRFETTYKIFVTLSLPPIFLNLIWTLSITSTSWTVNVILY